MGHASCHLRIYTLGFRTSCILVERALYHLLRAAEAVQEFFPLNVYREYPLAETAYLIVINIIVCH